jgi:hypothetical protein
MVIFHPLVKVIISPNLLFCKPLHQQAGLATRAVAPAELLWG